MKTFVSSVLLHLLCIQILLAIADVKLPTISCKRDRNELRTNAIKFFDRLKKVLESGHNALAGIVKLDANLFQIEHNYLPNNYAIDGKGAKMKLKSFVDGFRDPFITLSGFVNNVNADCDKMLMLANEFAKDNNLTCSPRKSSKGCEGQLEALQCELFDLLKSLKEKRENAIAAIKVMKATLPNLNRMVKELSSALGGLKEIDLKYCEVLTVSNRFFVEFNQRHWIGYTNFVNLQHICDEITSRISILDVKYKCIE